MNIDVGDIFTAIPDDVEGTAEAVFSVVDDVGCRNDWSQEQAVEFFEIMEGECATRGNIIRQEITNKGE